MNGQHLQWALSCFLDVIDDENKRDPPTGEEWPLAVGIGDSLIFGDSNAGSIAVFGIRALGTFLSPAPFSRD